MRDELEGQGWEPTQPRPDRRSPRAPSRPEGPSRPPVAVATGEALSRPGSGSGVQAPELVRPAPAPWPPRWRW